MIQFKCPQCEKAFHVNDSYAGKHAKCSCGQPITVPGASAPPTPPALPTAKPLVKSPSVDAVPSRPPMDAYQKALLGVGAGCLAVLAVSTLLNWVSIFGGGMMGIEGGDGKIVLILCLCVGGGLVAELAIKKRSVASVIVAQAWGTIACLWMLGEIWRVNDNPRFNLSKFYTACNFPDDEKKT